VGHTGFVSHEGSEVDWLGLVIMWVSSDGSLMMLGSSLWEVTQMTISWVLKLSVRHDAKPKTISPLGERIKYLPKPVGPCADDTLAPKR